jgi:hypothetical protein
MRCGTAAASMKSAAVSAISSRPMPAKSSPATEAILRAFWPVYAESGSTLIAPLDEPGREALLKRLYTPGELLRMDQLRPDTSLSPEKLERQLRLLDNERA